MKGIGLEGAFLYRPLLFKDATDVEAGGRCLYCPFRRACASAIGETGAGDEGCDNDTGASGDDRVGRCSLNVESARVCVGVCGTKASELAIGSAERGQGGVDKPLKWMTKRDVTC